MKQRIPRLISGCALLSFSPACASVPAALAQQPAVLEELSPKPSWLHSDQLSSSLKRWGAQGIDCNQAESGPISLLQEQPSLQPPDAPLRSWGALEHRSSPLLKEDAMPTMAQEELSLRGRHNKAKNADLSGYSILLALGRAKESLHGIVKRDRQSPEMQAVDAMVPFMVMTLLMSFSLLCAAYCCH